MMHILKKKSLELAMKKLEGKIELLMQDNQNKKALNEINKYERNSVK